MAYDTPQVNSNQGVLSMFEGIGQGISQVGQIGLMDALETRRSQMENNLRMKLKSKDREFTTSEREAGQEFEAGQMEKKYELEGELAQQKAAAKATSDKAKDGQMLTPGGQPVKMDEVRKLYADANGLNSEMIDWDKVEPDFNKWAKSNGFTWVGAKPMPPMDESIARERLRMQYPDATEDQINRTIQNEIKAGRISAGAATPAATPATPAATPGAEQGIMDAFAADAGEPASGEFAGGAPGGLAISNPPGVETAIPEPTITSGGQATAGMPGMAEQEQRRQTLQTQLMKYRMAQPSGGSRGLAKKRSEKVQKAAKQVVAALKKGNINQVSKENVRIALNNQPFVGNLTEEQLQTLIGYLGQGNGG